MFLKLPTFRSFRLNIRMRGGAWAARAARSLWRLETRKVEVQTRRAAEAVRLKSLRGSRSNRRSSTEKTGYRGFRVKSMCVPSTRLLHGDRRSSEITCCSGRRVCFTRSPVRSPAGTNFFLLVDAKTILGGSPT